MCVGDVCGGMKKRKKTTDLRVTLSLAFGKSLIEILTGTSEIKILYCSDLSAAEVVSLFGFN